MKRVISILLLLSLTFSLFACTAPKNADDASCEDIIAAYENAGYTMEHHLHEDPVYLEEGICCSLMFEDPENPDKNYIHINRYNTNNEAYTATKEQKYNVLLWLFGFIHGETRWLKSEQFGKLHYTTYEKEMFEPLYNIVD